MHIRSIRSNPNFQIFRRAHVTVRRQSMPAYDQVLNVVRVEGE